MNLKKLFSVLLLAALAALTLSACAGGDGWDEVTTAIPAVRPDAPTSTTPAPETDPPATDPAGTDNLDTTDASGTTAAPGTLTGDWVGTYVNGDYKLVITRTQDIGNFISAKLTGGSLPNLTIVHELLSHTDSFADDKGFGVTLTRKGDGITVTATGDKIKGYSGSYKKQ